MNLPELTCTQATKNPVATNRNRCPRRSQSDLLLRDSEMRIHAIKHAAVVLGVTSPHAEGEAGALLQTFAQRRTQQSARRPDAALALHVAHEAESTLRDHLAG